MIRQQMQLRRQRADDAARYGYSIQGSDPEVRDEDALALAPGHPVLRLLAAVTLAIAVGMVFLATLVIERLGELSNRN